MRTPFFPLANLLPLTVLTAIGVATVLLFLFCPEVSDLSVYWSALGFAPLIVYLGDCYRRAKRRTAVEHAVEREIIIADLRLLAAERCARFWAACFAIAAGAGFLAALLVWAYQIAIWYRAEVWAALTWNSAVGIAPTVGNAVLQRAIHWLGDTNLGVVAIVISLLIAAPLATFNHRANLTVRRRKKELGNLKKTPISSYEL